MVSTETALRQMDRGIYRSAESREAVESLYERLLGAWPVPYRRIGVPTRYGIVNVIESGPPDGRPALLLHAASMASISWAPNVAALTDAGVRTYAVDYIGEANLSALDDPSVYPKRPEQVGSLYVEIADGLGLERSTVIGASNGGHAALRYALAAPERVSRLALLGPMGITRLPLSAVARMMMVSLRPTPRRVRHTVRWAIGTDPTTLESCGEWFDLVLRSVSSPPRVAGPAALEHAEMGALRMPVLLVLGDHDNLVGDERRARRRAGHFPAIRIETLSSGHLLGVERAAEVNEMIVGFCGGD